MFDTVRNNPKLIQGFLVLITLPFAFWGVESYVRNAASNTDVASVGDSKISLQELQKSLTEQQDRMRATLGKQFDPAMFDTPEVRQAVLDSLINQRLLTLQAGKAHLNIGDAQLAQFIANIPQLQEGGKFSQERYEALVANQGMSKEGFEARLRRDLALQQVASAVSDTGVVARASSNRWLAAQLEEREISEVFLHPEQFLAQAKIGDAAVKAYYDANKPQFETPEQVRAEYLTLSRDALADQVTVSEDDIKKAYAEHADRYRQAEQRRASHILIRAAKDASEADLKIAKAKADEILAQVKKSPGEFAKLAKASSQDPGSAEKGGDLDWISRGMMVKPFEDAVFALKENQISDVVRSDFGFHIIQLTGVKAEQGKPLEQVRGEIVAELKSQGAAKKYAEIAEGFTNTVYEQADSLKPAADKYKLTIQQSPLIAKGVPTPGPFGNAKLNKALFSDDAIKNKRNTEAVEVAPNTLMAARIVEYKPAALVPLETVKADIEKRLSREEAGKLARADGEARLAKLNKGEQVEAAWGVARSVLRVGAANLPPAAATAIFKADASKLPSYVGTALPDGGYGLYRVAKVKSFVAGEKPTPQEDQLRKQYTQLVAEEEFGAWLSTLRQRFPVSVNKAVLETKERP
jgi:peptidyl-prolyl cis-trans isomerase D